MEQSDKNITVIMSRMLRIEYYILVFLNQVLTFQYKKRNIQFETTDLKKKFIWNTGNKYLKIFNKYFKILNTGNKIHLIT